MYFLIALAGLAAWYYFSRVTEVHNGVVHFTQDGRQKALAQLATVGVTATAAQVPGANLTLVTAPLVSLAVSGVDAVQQAEAAGGVVVLSDSFLERPVGAMFVVCSRGQESVASPGSGLAVLSILPG